LVLSLLFAGACAKSAGPRTGAGAVTTTTVAVPGATPAPAGAAPRRLGTVPPARAGGSGGAAATPAATVATDASPAIGVGSPGGLARVILRPTPATEVVVELRNQAGAAPRPHTTSHATDVLRQVSGKTVTVAPGSVAGGSRSWSNDDLVAVARQGRPTVGDGKVVLHVLFLHGDYAEDANALGVALGADVIAVFPDAIDAAGSPLVDAGTIEDAVTLHEIGHLMGLVDLALSTHRGDPEHPGHSANRSSVMYWAVDSDLLSQALGGPPSTAFDQRDLEDLAALRAGA
jgi:hypothetical protein